VSILIGKYIISWGYSAWFKTPPPRRFIWRWWRFWIFKEVSVVDVLEVTKEMKYPVGSYANQGGARFRYCKVVGE